MGITISNGVVYFANIRKDASRGADVHTVSVLGSKCTFPSLNKKEIIYFRLFKKQKKKDSA